MPTEDIIVYKICPECNGTRERPPIPDGQGGFLDTQECLTCNNIGYIAIGKMGSGSQIDKILRRLKKIMKKLNIEDE